LEDSKNVRKNRTIRAAAGAAPSRAHFSKVIKNTILSSLPAREFSLLSPHLQQEVFESHSILHEAGEPIQFAYFLNEGLASLVILTREGKSVEVAVVGSEGLTGIPLTVGIDRGPYRVIMQSPGSGFKVKAESLMQVLRSAPELHRLLDRYSLVQGLQIAQIAACNRLHEIDQRLARWLLMCQDRVNSDLLPVTHEFLGQMLGAGRPSVSLAAGTLQRAGLITNLRGKVRIQDRKSLEQAACECYRAILAFA